VGVSFNNLQGLTFPNPFPPPPPPPPAAPPGEEIVFLLFVILATKLVHPPDKPAGVA
jgi:hypothetical protein